MGTVGGVLSAPIGSIMYNCPSSGRAEPATHRAPAHFGSVPERHTATPRSTLPASISSTATPKVAIIRVLAKMVGRLSNSSTPARTACPSSGAAKVVTPPIVRNRALPKTVTTIAHNPMRPARLEARWTPKANVPKIAKTMPRSLRRRCLST
jgi:hypothetical protein